MIMKKTFYILSVILFAAMGCTKEFEQSFVNEDQTVPDGAQVTLTFSVPTTPQTRAEMALKPDFSPTKSKMHVLVFNAKTGSLLEVREAVLTDSANDNGPSHKATYRVALTMGSTARVLHFIIDAPTYETDGSVYNETGLGYKYDLDEDGNPDVAVYLGDSESTVASKLFTTDGKAAFWQRVELPNGLKAYTYPGGTPKYYTAAEVKTGPLGDYYIDHNDQVVNVGDFINEDGDKITTGTGYLASQVVQDEVAVIPMIRNFTLIQVTSIWSNFILEKAALVNIPYGGFIAPYDADAGQFVDLYSGVKDAYTFTAETVGATGYNPLIPTTKSGIIRTFREEGATLPTAVNAENGVVNLFMYERGIPTSDATAVIVGGKLNNQERWFKFDMNDSEGQYPAIYRDITYEMKISEVAGSAGYTSMQAAFDAPAIGDISANPATKTLTMVSDDNRGCLWVDFIDYTHVGESATATLRYKFWRIDHPEVTSENVAISVSHSTSDQAITGFTNGAAYPDTDTQDGQSGWYYTTVTLSGTGGSIKRSVLRVKGTYTITGTDGTTKDKSLYRDVTFTVMNNQDFGLDVSKLQSDAISKETTITITLPDNLGYSVFPLVVRIEADKQNINPTDNIPVDHGPSTIPGKNVNSFYFLYTIDYSKYSTGIRDFEAKFKTTKTTGNETEIYISDSKGYFNSTHKTLSISN